MDNYYNIDTHVSNSDLGRLNNLINGTDPFSNSNMQAIFDFGSLVDCMLLEPENVIYSEKRLVVPSGGDVTFDDQTWARAISMRNAGRKDRILSMYIKNMSAQQTLKVDKFNVEYMGNMFDIPARCKYDLCSLPMRMGADLKTTACTSLKSFKQTIEAMDYDRQGAWYMDLGNLDNFMFIGISKTAVNGKHEVFHVAFDRNSDLYKSGLRKYQRLAYMYKLLIL